MRLVARWLSASLPMLVPGVAVAAPAYELWVRSDPALLGCPDAAELEQRVNQRLGRDASMADGSGPAAVAVTVWFTPQGRTTRARIRWRFDADTLGERKLDGPPGACSELVEATVLAVTLLVEEGTALAEKRRSEALVSPDPLSADASAVATSTACAACEALLLERAEEQRIARERKDAPPAPPSGTIEAGRAPPGLDVVGVVGKSVGPETAWGIGVRGAVGLGRSWGLTWGGEYLSGGSVARGGYELRFGQATFWVGAALMVAFTRSLTVEPEVALLGGVSVVATNPVDPGEYPLLGERMGLVVGWQPWQSLLRVSVGAHARALSFRDVYETEGADGPQWRQPPVGFTAEVGLGLREW